VEKYSINSDVFSTTREQQMETRRWGDGKMGRFKLITANCSLLTVHCSLFADKY
jgi:hypothetical protein